jgi:hypothetical protein
MYSLYGVTTGANNVAMGYEALKNNTTGGDNVAVGSGAGDAITTGSNNTAIGRDSLSVMTTQSGNTAVGRGAGFNAATSGLTYLGFQAGYNTSTGYDNVAVGTNALFTNTTGNENVAIGYRALIANTTACDNTAVGNGALDSATTGGNNTGIGRNSLAGVTTGIENVGLGSSAGDTITTGRANICIGHGATTATSDRVYSITMGRDVASVGDYYFTFGVDAASHRVYNNFTSNASWTRASDERIKKDITTNTDCGLDFVNDLRTVTYKFKAPSELDSKMTGYDASKTEAIHKKKMYGFVAQEVKAAMKTHNITDFAGHHELEDGKDNMQGISYEMFVMPLVKAVQELSTQVDELKAEIQELKG